MSLQGGSGKNVCGCSNYTRDRGEEIRQREIYTVLLLSPTVYIHFTYCTYPSGEELVLLCLRLADRSSAALLSIPSLMVIFLEGSHVKSGEGRLRRYRPWTWRSTICHTQQALMATASEWYGLTKEKKCISNVKGKLQRCAPLHDWKHKVGIVSSHKVHGRKHRFFTVHSACDFVETNRSVGYSPAFSPQSKRSSLYILQSFTDKQAQLYRQTPVPPTHRRTSNIWTRLNGSRKSTFIIHLEPFFLLIWRHRILLHLDIQYDYLHLPLSYKKKTVHVSNVQYGGEKSLVWLSWLHSSIFNFLS